MGLKTSNAQNCLEIIREQRHSFINHLQVISGYLQLNRAEDAQRYLESVARELAQFSQINRVQRPELALTLLTIISAGAQVALKVDLAVTSDFAGCAAPDAVIGRLVGRMWDCLREAALFDGEPEQSLQLTLYARPEQYLCGFVFPEPDPVALAALECVLADLDPQLAPYAVRQNQTPAAGFREIALVFAGGGPPEDPAFTAQVKDNVL